VELEFPILIDYFPTGCYYILVNPVPLIKPISKNERHKRISCAFK
jgi:hypothetical protein